MKIVLNASSQHCSDVVPENRIGNSLNRVFGYKLGDKKATSNMLKAASREPFELIEKQKCDIIVLSVGAYKEVMFPLLSDWKAGKTSIEDELSIDKFEPGYDDDGKHVDSLVNLTYNSKKVTVCCYNTTQRIKIEGKGYIDFTRKYLSKALMNNITSSATRIDDYNKAVIATLSRKRKVVSRPPRSVCYKTMS